MRIPSLDANSQKELSSLTEEHLTLLVREAVAVQRHCKRARIHLPATTGNTTAAVVNQTAAHAGGGILKRRLHAEDINMALQWRGSEKIYATSSAVSAISSSSSSAKSSNHSLHRDIKKIMLEDYLKTEMDTPPPQEVGLTVHWLAVDGVQPDIPQNPSRPAAPVEPSTGLASVSKRSKRSDVVHEIEADDEGDPDNVPSAAGLVDPVLSTATGATVRMGQLSSNLGLTVGDSTASVQVAQLLPRVVSEELRLYYGRITTVVDRVAETGMMREEQDAALTRLAQDAGIQELVPFLLQFVAQRLFQNTFDSSHGRVLVRMARSLLRNPHLHLEIHIHSLLAPLLTKVVARRVSARQHDDHWILRKEAAATLVEICNLYGSDYASLKARILKQFCEAIGLNKPLSTRYGGIVGISLFGPRAVHAFLFPLILGYWEKWQELLDKTSDPRHRHEIYMCQQAILDSIGVFLRSGPSTLAAAAAAATVSERPNLNFNDDLMLGWDELEDAFGDRMVMLSSSESEYGLCFI